MVRAEGTASAPLQAEAKAGTARAAASDTTIVERRRRRRRVERREEGWDMGQGSGFAAPCQIGRSARLSPDGGWADRVVRLACGRLGASEGWEKTWKFRVKGA